MKSAEEWALYLGRPNSCASKCNRKCVGTCVAAVDLARAIQRDAQVEIAERFRNLGNHYFEMCKGGKLVEGARRWVEAGAKNMIADADWIMAGLPKEPPDA
jgi:hypothetical protein